MRLIDADELKELVQGSDNLIDLQKEEMCICIDACDTAYDVNKVVEQLEDIIVDYTKKTMYLRCCGISEAIEIVKAGGVNE